jgi:hypothetical protein
MHSRASSCYSFHRGEDVLEVVLFIDDPSKETENSIRHIDSKQQRTMDPSMTDTNVKAFQALVTLSVKSLSGSTNSK